MQVLDQTVLFEGTVEESILIRSFEDYKKEMEVKRFADLRMK